jgi:hypothetical protein
MKRLVVNDFDIDAKRTKKNLGSMVSANKFIEPTDSANIKRGKLNGANVVDKIVLGKPIKQDNSIVEVVEIVQETQQSSNENNPQTKENNKITSKFESGKFETGKAASGKTESGKFETGKSATGNFETGKAATSKKELVPGEPLKYYTKKDKHFVSWPSKAELYDVSKFKDMLDVYLGMAPFFNKKQLKNKTSIEEINKELKEAYGFRKLNNFKPVLLEVIYKIIIGDKIKFTFE